MLNKNNSRRAYGENRGGAITLYPVEFASICHHYNNVNENLHIVSFELDLFRVLNCGGYRTRF